VLNPTLVSLADPDYIRQCLVLILHPLVTDVSAADNGRRRESVQQHNDISDTSTNGDNLDNLDDMDRSLPRPRAHTRNRSLDAQSVLSFYSFGGENPPTYRFSVSVTCYHKLKVSLKHTGWACYRL
jgi:hypothetical protein